jgi:hypothetical protein
MILSTAGKPIKKVVSVKFVYDGQSRIVDNIDIEKSGVIVGFEMRKSGKFSYKIKRYSTDKIKNFKFIEPPHRSGPVLSRPVVS